MSDLLRRVGTPVEVQPDRYYREIGVRSHGKGIFHKEKISGASLGDKRVFHVVPKTLVFNIVFAWERAVALVSDDEDGFIASHRFPMFSEVDGNSYLPFIRELLLRPRGQALLSSASPGGAGRNKTLGQQAFLKLKTPVPSRAEQVRIADFVAAISARLEGLQQEKALLDQYRKGFAEQLLAGKLRFRQADGTQFPDWGETRLGAIATFHKGQGLSKQDITSSGRTLCIRYGELYTTYRERITKVASATDVDPSSLFLSERGDVIIPASGEDALEMARACCVEAQGVALGSDINVIRSGMNGTFLAYYLNHMKRHDIARLAQGMSVIHLYSTHLKQLKVMAPAPEEQQKIVSALCAFDEKIDALASSVERLTAFKTGLLQKMFV
jgi:type I restriction enzyme S subunit